MWDHLRCRCGHQRMLHGGRTDTECRICHQVWQRHERSMRPLPCYRFRWWLLPFARL